MTPDGILRVTGAVIVSGPWLAVVRRAVVNAEHLRRRNGLGPSPEYTVILAALTAAMTASGHTDITDGPAVADSSYDDWFTTTAAARRLGISARQCRRIAPRLNGRRISGRWLIDPAAVAEHRAGTTPGDRP